MKLILPLIALLISFSLSGQNTDLKDIRKATLESLRNFSSSIAQDKFTNKAAIDSLRNSVSSLVVISRKVKDTIQLKIITDYFTSANNELLDTNISGEELNTIVKNINKDLRYKTAEFKDHAFNLEGGLNFGKKKNIKVSAYINGEMKNTQEYRLFWTFYTGRTFEKLISKKGKSSNKFTNPFTVDIVVPGYITFWLVNNSNGTIYKPDIIYTKFGYDDSDTDIDISFQKL